MEMESWFWMHHIFRGYTYCVRKSEVINPLGGRGGPITSGQEFETSPANMVKPSLLKTQKLARRGWCYVPVVPATREAEAG